MSEKIKINIELELSDQFCYDVMVMAVESNAIGYWASIRNLKRDDQLNVLSFACIEIGGGNDDQSTRRRMEINPAAIAKGIGLVLSPGFKVRKDILTMVATAAKEDEADIDIEGADVIIQAAMLGELVYG